MNHQIVLFGLGPHARRIYYPMLERYAKTHDLEISLVVELSDQVETVSRYLSVRELQPKDIYYIDASLRNDRVIDRSLLAVLQETPCTHVIIATEPKSHVMYATWALENKKALLMDKPIGAPAGLSSDITAIQKIMEEYNQLKRVYTPDNPPFSIQCQRRYHAGYQYIYEYLRDFVGEFSVPVSYMDLYHADGMWNMPDEFFFRENHPYKYGYGKLLHSGYHFLDLYAWMMTVNDQLKDKAPTQLEIISRKFSTQDFFHQVTNTEYKQFFNREYPQLTEDVRGFGELDTYSIIQAKRGGHVVTTASINLQQNSFSRRAWPVLPEDTYKGNGRVRHERFVAQVGNLLSIQVHSYQAHEVKKKDVEVVGAGNEDHFDIYIYRNSELVGGVPLEKITLGEKMREQYQNDGYKGHNEYARRCALHEWLNNERGIGDYLNHELTNRILAKQYEALLTGRGVTLLR